MIGPGPRDTTHAREPASSAGSPLLTEISSNGRCTAAALLIMMLPIPVAASAAGELASASSENITISVSVAPRYKVQALPALSGPRSDRSQPGGVRFCLETNTATMPLRADLVAASDDQSPAVTHLAHCPGTAAEALAPPHPGVTTSTRLVLIRPQ